MPGSRCVCAAMALYWEYRDTVYAHLAQQFFAGIVYGLGAGYAEFHGHHQVSHFILLAMVVITLLDHLGFVYVPYCWHGRGAEVDRIPPLTRLTSELIFWEVMHFVFFNTVLFASFVMFYGLGSGRRISPWHVIHHSLKGRTWI